MGSIFHAETHILHQAEWTTDNQYLFDKSEVVLISVRPEHLASISPQTEGKLIISVRALPNAAAEVRRSYSPWIAARSVSSSDRDLVRSIFQCCGEADELSNEADLDYFAGLTGAGPAFPALLGAALINDAISRGISRDIAYKAVTTLLVGSGRLLESGIGDLQEIVERFMSYDGTTAAAMSRMNEAGFEQSIREGLKAALSKSQEFGSETA